MAVGKSKRLTKGGEKDGEKKAGDPFQSPVKEVRNAGKKFNRADLQLDEDQPSKKMKLCVEDVQAASAAELAATESIVQEFSSDFDCHAMPAETRRLLAPLIHRWGNARVKQILGLWTFLGDNGPRRVCASTLQVWGPAGTGKSAIVTDYLRSMGIRHVRLNCASFTSAGELNARFMELVRRSAVGAAGSQIGELPSSLQRNMPVGQEVRSLDKLETMSRLPLQTLSRSGDADGLLPPSDISEAPVKIVIVIDNAQELPRLGSGAVEFLSNLPEVLQWGNQLSVVIIGRLRLGSLGVNAFREPPAVAFTAYSEAEAEAALNKVLIPEEQARRGSEVSSDSGLATADVCKGLIKFACPHLGRNLQQLLTIGRQLLRDGLPKDAAGGWSGAAFQQCVMRAVQRRQGICDLSKLLRRGEAVEGMDTASVSALVTLRQMTRAEMRLILAAYLAGYVEKEDDILLFMPEVRRKAKRKMCTKQSQAEAAPVYTRAPRPTSLSRLLAIYHRLARRPQLLGPPMFEHLNSLREAGLIRFQAARACLDQDVKVTCRAQLPLVRAIASELNISLAEYLTQY